MWEYVVGDHPYNHHSSTFIPLFLFTQRSRERDGGDGGDEVGDQYEILVQRFYLN